jgi:hypothetical protein
MKDILRKIKYSRLKPEERFLIDILHNVTIFENEEYPNNLYYKYNNEIVFNYNLKNGNFYANNTKIWSILNSKFHLNYQQVSLLIKGMVEEHLKLKEITPHSY